MATLTLPTSNGRLEAFSTSAQPNPAPAAEPFCRIALAATHIVADPLADCDPWLDAVVDWDATIAYRRYVWDLGLGVAEAMDTAQRGMGLDWAGAQELIRRSIDASSDTPGAVVASGVGTDQLEPAPGVTVDDVIAAYDEQCGFVEKCGGSIVLMASRALAACAQGPDDYARVYDHVLSQVRAPVIIHWLGEMFDPALAGYWGDDAHDAAMAVCLDVIADNAAKVDGIKISLLDKDREIAMRRQLPDGVRMYTGDDFNFAELIAGDDEGYSDALLGIFDAIAPAASSALAALTRGESERFYEILEPTVALSRHIFQAPTRFYKTGVVCMAYLNGHQDHFTLIGGQQSARSLAHLAELFRLADKAGLLRDPDLAAARMKTVLALHGIEA